MTLQELRHVESLTGPSLVARQISVKFGELKAVDDVSLGVEAGEAVGLIGPNGAGKTTFFNALTGYIGASEGAIHVDGNRLRSRVPWDVARAGIVRTFQNHGVFPMLSVEENLRIARSAQPTAVHEVPPEKTPALNELRRTVLAAGATTLADALSYGQQRFLSLAMAFAASPKFLLLDEPAAGLNPSETAVVAGLLDEARSNGLGVVVVEHDMAFLMPLVDVVYVLDAGKLIAVGTPAAVQSDPAVHRAYLGGPASDARDK